MAIRPIYVHLGGLVVCYGLALAAAVALSVPILSFLFLIFTFGLGYIPMLAVGFVALLGPLALLVHAAVVWFRRTSPRPIWITAHVWLCSLIVHTGASYGQSHWGDVGSVMGAKNMPYVQAFLSPLIFIAERLNIPLLRTAV